MRSIERFGAGPSQLLNQPEFEGLKRFQKYEHKFAEFTDVQKHIVSGLARGLSRDEVAQELQIPFTTVRSQLYGNGVHYFGLFGETEVSNDTELIAYGYETGNIDIAETSAGLDISKFNDLTKQEQISFICAVDMQIAGINLYDVAESLGMAFPTLRGHLNKSYKKLGIVGSKKLNHAVTFRYAQAKALQE